MKLLSRTALRAMAFALVLVVLWQSDTPAPAIADHENQLTISVTTDPSGGSDFQFQIDGPGSCNFNRTIDHNEAEAVGCPSPGGAWSIAIATPQGWTVDTMDCQITEDGDTGGTISDVAVSPSEISNKLVGLTVEDDEHVNCNVKFKQGSSSGSVIIDPANPLDPDGDGDIEYVAIAVTADPNVIPCGGTTNLTATARAIDTGLVVPSHLLGFHWETDIGQLYVGPPNTADATDNRATLTLVPGMGNATVKAWVGDLSENPGEVTVQQFCLGVTTDSSTAPGAVQLSASKQTVGCKEGIFVGARIRDAKNQVVPDGTVVNFMASDGTFSTNDGDTAQFTAVTINGVLNIPYKAPNYGGQVFITAASGDKFSQMLIDVQCAAAAPVTTAGSSGAPRPCTPIGDGICITPPSTGSAGLRR